MTTGGNHPLLEFTERYANPSFDYLNAFMAVARLDTLLEDLALTRGLLEANWPVEQRWHPWHGAEIVSYYAVGFVTCLEWHAKSRLNDLFTFKPASMTLDDVKGTISDKLIVQMVAKQASVTQLVSASVIVGRTEKYIAIIDRVFKYLGMPFTVMDWLTGKSDKATVCWVRPDQLAKVDWLFEFRHRLVHEIGITTMGHLNVRGAWGPQDAAAYGGLTASIIYGVESAFTLYGPRLFPNLLTEERHPVSITETLTQELERVNNLIDRNINRVEYHGDWTADAWVSARDRFSKYMDAEETFIMRAPMLHKRYFDARSPLRLRLLRYRLGFLREFLSHCPFEVERDTPDAPQVGLSGDKPA